MIILFRCKSWLQACGREDLPASEYQQYYKNRRLCSNHFEDHMYMGPSKNRLLPSAIPKKIESDTNVQGESNCNNVLDLEPPAKKICIVENAKGSSHQGDIVDTTMESCFLAIPGPSHQRDIVDDTMKSLVPLGINIGVQTPAWFSAGTPRKRKLRNKISNLQKENLSLRNEIIKFTENQYNIEIFQSACKKFLSPEVANFVNMQVIQNNRDIYGRRYTEDFKIFAISLYFVGPKCYRQLQKTFVLPSTRVLERYLERLRFLAGINNNLFTIVKLKVDKMSDLDKYCTICVDEIAIKCNLYYDYGYDEIIGFEDDGVTKNNNPANYATVIMARGIKESWKQPLGYIFNSTGVNAELIKTHLDNFICKLREIGLTVISLVTDMGPNFTQLASILGVTENNSKILLGGFELYYIFDPPHLLKAIRNNMIKYSFQWKNKKASWAYIQQFYNKDKELNNRLAPKLTNSHIYPTNFEKMRVKYATQVISATVSAGLETYLTLECLPTEAIGTIEMIALFDIVNSSNLTSSKVYNRAFSGQKDYIDFLNSSLEFLNQLVVIGDKGKNMTSYVKCIKGWKITIRSIMNIWTYLKNKKFSFLLTRRLNQDCLENFFGSIRQQNGNCVNPTPIQFARAFKKLFLADYFHSKFMNCMDDFDNILSNSSQLSEQAMSVLIVPVVRESFNVDNCDYYQQTLPEQNAFKYIAGYLIHKCLKIHSCQICKTFSTDNEAIDDSNLFIHFKAYCCVAVWFPWILYREFKRGSMPVEC